MDKEKIALSVFGVSAVAVVILFAIAFTQNTGMSGRVVQEIPSEQPQSTNIAGCSDTDGRNYDVKGVLSFCDNSGCTTNEDLCNGRMLIEWYCENNEKRYEEKLCEYTCDGGTCLGYVTKFSYPYAGSGGGGGGGEESPVSGGATTSAPTIRDLGELTFENTLEMNSNENLRFSIGGVNYLMILEGHSETQATLIAGSQEIVLGVGSDTKIDLNGNSVPDLYVWLRSINVLTGKVKLTLDLA